MKINKYVEELNAKSSAELNEELVAAKKELFNLRFQNATNQQNQRGSQEYCKNSDCFGCQGKLNGNERNGYGREKSEKDPYR